MNQEEYIFDNNSYNNLEFSCIEQLRQSMKNFNMIKN